MKLEECTARASTSKIVMARAQYALRCSCLRTFWFSLWSIPACLRCHVAGFLRCHVGHKMWAAESTSPQTPSRPPQSRSPRRAELSWRVRNVSVRVQARVRFVGLHGGWQPQKERRGGCFLATEIPPCRTPMSPNWVMDVRNQLFSPRQFQRTIKRAVSY